MSRFAFFLILMFLGAQAPGLHAALTAARSRTLARFKSQCEDGNGVACYDLARALKSMPGVPEHQDSPKYFRRACELRHKRACAVVHPRARKHRHQWTPPVANKSGPCFVNADLNRAKFLPHEIGHKIIHGHTITHIEEDSFWGRVGLSDGDIIVRVNNQTFDSIDEIHQVFTGGQKQFAFEVEHSDLDITIRYTCK